MNTQRRRLKVRSRPASENASALVAPVGRRILLAGASGIIGSALAAEFVRRGWWVRALTRRASDIKVEVNEIFVGDLMEPTTLVGALSGINMVFSAAGAPMNFVTGLAGRHSFADINDQANRRLLTMALDAQVKRFGYVASYGGRVLGVLQYIHSLESFIAALRSSGMEGLVVRTTPVFGGFDGLLRKAEKGKVRYVGDGYAEVNPIHQSDLAVAVADAIEADESDLDIGGPEVLYRRDIAELALEAWDREGPARSLRLPFAMLWARLAFLRGKHNRYVSQYVSAAAVTDMVAPEFGARTIEDYFAERVKGMQAEANDDPPAPWWQLLRR